MGTDEEIEDIDNIDLEEQMYQKDIADEEEAAEREAEDQAEAQAEEQEMFCTDYIKDPRLRLNAQNLDLDLTVVEPSRKTYRFKKDGATYEGHVLKMMNDDNYIFFVTTKERPEGFMKKFALSDIYQVKK